MKSLGYCTWYLLKCYHRQKTSLGPKPDVLLWPMPSSLILFVWGSFLPQTLTHPKVLSECLSACPAERSLPFACQNAYVNINRIMSVASRLSEAGHYASQQIKQISTQLDQEWKSFAAALDERSTILAMSAVFHQKAEQVSQGGCQGGCWRAGARGGDALCKSPTSL